MLKKVLKSYHFKQDILLRERERGSVIEIAPIPSTDVKQNKNFVENLLKLLYIFMSNLTIVNCLM